MASPHLAKKDSNLACIDADAENIIPDDTHSKICSLQQEGTSLSQGSNVDSNLQLNRVECKAEKLNASLRSPDCIIDMSAAQEDIGALVNFGLTSKTTQEGANEDYVMELLELNKVSSVTPNTPSSWENADLESTSTNGIGVEIQKKVKKRKKHKPKVMEENCNEELGGLSTSEGFKNIELHKSSNSENQPLAGNNSSSSRQNSYGSKPPKRRTIKSFQAEKEKFGASFPPPKLVSQGSNQISKEIPDKQGILEKNKQKQKEVEDIMKKLNFTEVSTASKKKLKENKHIALKKNKKKTKKSKKEGKQQEKEPSDQVEVESTKSLEPVLVDVQDDAVFCVTGEVLTNDSSKEFVTQGRRKAPHKQPASGRASPKTIATRKRRFSDPAPSANKNVSHALANSQRSSPRNRKANNAKTQDNGFAFSEALSDRESQLQWPTLPSLVDSANYKSTSNRSATSYASKLRSNLDSTGCSLASSSEDGSSTASSSSNYHSCPAGQISPVSGPHIADLPNIPFFIQAAAAQMVKNAGTSTDRSSAARKDLDNVLPAEIDCKTVGHVKDPENRDAALICPKTDVNRSNNVLASSVQHQLESSNDSTSGTAVSDTILHNNDPGIPSVTSHDEFNKKMYESVADIGDAKLSDVIVMSELDNKWGLNFFTDDFSSVKLDNNEQLYNDKAELSKTSNVQMTFEADKFVLNENPSKASLTDQNETKSKTSDNMFLLSIVNMRVDGTRTKWNDPGRFDLKKATSLLLQEWNAAVTEGNYYKDE